MITLAVSARCLRCPWSAAGPGSDWDAIDRAAEKHTKAKPGHPTSTVAKPATTDGEHDGHHGDHGRAGEMPGESVPGEIRQRS